MKSIQLNTQQKMHAHSTQFYWKRYGICHYIYFRHSGIWVLMISNTHKSSNFLFFSMHCFAQTFQIKITHKLCTFNQPSFTSEIIRHLPNTFAYALKVIGEGVRVTRQQVKYLSCTWLTNRAWSLAPHMVLRTLPGMVSEYRARSHPWVLRWLRKQNQQTKRNKGHR